MEEKDAVEIRLSGILSRYSPAGSVVKADAGQTIRDAVDGLGIPPNLPFVALVNGRTTDLSYLLARGDRLRLIPAIGGGGF